jgi:hypothetical protein
MDRAVGCGSTPQRAPAPSRSRKDRMYANTAVDRGRQFDIVIIDGKRQEQLCKAVPSRSQTGSRDRLGQRLLGGEAAGGIRPIAGGGVSEDRLCRVESRRPATSDYESVLPTGNCLGI